MKTFANFILEENKETDGYADFLEAKLKKYNVKSVSELSEEDKKKFLEEVKTEWENRK